MIVLGVLAAALAAWIPLPAAGTSCEAMDESEVLQLELMQVRLNGVDAPERKERLASAQANLRDLWHYNLRFAISIEGGHYVESFNESP